MAMPPTDAIPEHPVVLINIFTVDPANQDELVSLLTKATATTVRRVDGFVSATLHKSLDGTKVAMYARWRSEAHYSAMRRQSSTSPFLDQALRLATFDPGMYTVVEEFLPTGT
jgi:quinol monooxygenase YgiN